MKFEPFLNVSEEGDLVEGHVVEALEVVTVEDVEVVVDMALMFGNRKKTCFDLLRSQNILS